MAYGKAVLCRFKGNSKYEVDIIRTKINVLSYISKYQSGERLKFNLTADDKIFNGHNTTIDIYKDKQLYTTVYGLTGEGWIVDLEPGEYTAVLRAVPAHLGSGVNLPGLSLQVFALNCHQINHWLSPFSAKEASPATQTQWQSAHPGRCWRWG